MVDFILIARTILILSVAGVIMLNVPLLAWAFWVPYSAYLLVLRTEVAFDFTEFVWVDVVEVGVGVGMPIFLGGSLFVAERIPEEVAHMLDLYPPMRLIEGMLSLIFWLDFFLAGRHFEAHVHFFFLVLNAILSLEWWLDLAWTGLSSFKRSAVSILDLVLWLGKRVVTRRGLRNGKRVVLIRHDHCRYSLWNSSADYYWLTLFVAK